MRALEASIGLARETGVGIAFARASNHFGPVAPYSLLAAEAGFASIIGSNASTTIAPTGGRDARLGNSPVGFCVPNPGGQPILLDMALSVVARAKIRGAAKRGEAIPPTWATDKDGRPTTDPKAALDGFLLPIGGHKGYGLALIVDLFAGLLSGAAYLTHVSSWADNPEAPQDLGHFFFLIDAARLGPPEWLAGRMRDFAAILHDAPRADPATPVLLPGEIELGKLERHRRDGIALDPALISRLESLAARGSA
jgi:LDH2 family malate/lactate/ureidoglycolate dehydrogenase